MEQKEQKNNSLDELDTMQYDSDNICNTSYVCTYTHCNPHTHAFQQAVKLNDFASKKYRLTVPSIFSLYNDTFPAY